MKTPVIQFGTSRFLQAHADLFLSEGTPAMAITVVQTSGDPARAHRLTALAAPAGYPVRIRGLMAGETVDETRTVTSVKRCLSATDQWDEVTRVFVEEADYVLSNTGDAGYAGKPDDALAHYSAAMSFPAKLYHLLAARHAAGGRALTILPMELIVDNGKVLRSLVEAIAEANGASDALRSYLASDVVWASSLVDRIVSEPIEPAGAVAEPYALWAIEKGPGVTAPSRHPAIQLVDDLAEIESLKLNILNLGHTVLVDLWQRQGSTEGMVVRSFIAREDVRRELQAVYEAEVLPVFAHRGLGEKATGYLASTMERFANPFLDHKLSDIAQNHVQKVSRRIEAFVARARQDGYSGSFDRLSGVIERAGITP
jgi:tagaturonate reductase